MRGLVITLALLSLVSPVGVVLALLTESQRERACVAAGSTEKHCFDHLPQERVLEVANGLAE